MTINNNYIAHSLSYRDYINKYSNKNNNKNNNNNFYYHENKIADFSAQTKNYEDDHCECEQIRMKKQPKNPKDINEKGSRSSLKSRIRIVPPHYNISWHWIIFVCLAIITSVHTSRRALRQISGASEEQFARLLARCQLGTTDFDECMRGVLNELRVFYPTGIPAYNIKPFDPHRASYVELRRGDLNGLAGMRLILRNVSEYGWTNSKITKYRTDLDHQRIIYSQFFPKKSLEGYYEMTGNMLGAPMNRNGYWNMTLSDYSQTTSIRRLGGPGSSLKVHIEIDNLGGLKMHISDFLAQGRQNLDNISDTVINSMWQLGFPMIKPLINELISTAFTDIFNDSFRYFPLDKFIR